VTISLVNEARGGPFVLWDDLAASCGTAQSLGFDGVEIFAPEPEAISHRTLGPLLEQHQLRLAAVGTGGGWVLHRLSLTSADPDVRSRAREFVRSMIDAGGRLGAPAILGSMQGRWGDGVNRETAIAHLAAALEDLGEHARRHNVPLLYEPLNRYETNLVNTLDQGVELLRSLRSRNIKLLADLYHMNIEEPDLAESLRAAGAAVGHVHFADSNRRPIGFGHTDVTRIADALRDIGYDGYLSAECVAYPDPHAAAETTIRSFQKYFSKC
jgi:sugar phosphate isomerase/epimerase